MPDRKKLVVAVTDPRGAIFFRGQLRFMTDRGFDVVLISAPGDIAREITVSQGARHFAVKMSREIDVRSDVLALYRIWRFMRRERPSLVNATTPKAGLLVTLGAWLAGIPVRVYTLRGLRGETLTGFRGRIVNLTERLACRLAHRVICISPSLQNRAVEIGIVAKQKSVVLGSGSSNGIEVSRFSATPKRIEAADRIRNELGIQNGPVIGFVGRLVNDKGVRELLEAWSRLRDSHPSATLLLVGPFESGDALDVPYREQISIDSRIHHVDWVDDPAPYYLAMDLVVLPSYREGFGNVLLEAAFMERPVVATTIPGCVDAVVDGETGFLIPPQNPRALEVMIERYLDDPDLRQRHGRRGRERAVREFRSERVWNLIADEYDRLTAAVRGDRNEQISGGHLHTESQSSQS